MRAPAPVLVQHLPARAALVPVQLLLILTLWTWIEHRSWLKMLRM